MTRRLIRYVAVLATSGAALVAGQDAAEVPSGGAANVDWPVYRGDAKGNQYSPLAQIHAANVHRLERAWEYKTGDANQRSTMHANPVVVDGVMYITTPSLKAVALNAATGKEIWAFDPAKYNNGNVVRLRNRGVVYWKGTGGERIFHFVRDRVYAVDAKTGALITTFGTDGFIDLRQNLGMIAAREDRGQHHGGARGLAAAQRHQRLQSAHDALHLAIAAGTRSHVVGAGEHHDDFRIYAVQLAVLEPPQHVLDAVRAPPEVRRMPSRKVRGPIRQQLRIVERAPAADDRIADEVDVDPSGLRLAQQLFVRNLGIAIGARRRAVRRRIGLRAAWRHAAQHHDDRQRRRQQ